MTPFKMLLLALFGSTFAAAQAPAPVVVAPAPSPSPKRRKPKPKTAVFDYRSPAPSAPPAPAPVLPRRVATKKAKKPATRPPAPKRRKKLAPRGAPLTVSQFRSEVVKIPGSMWEPLTTVDAVARAMADKLRDQLWDTGEGSTLAVPMDDGRILGFLAIGDEGVSVWRLKPGTVVPEGGFPPKVTQEEPEEPEEVELEPEEAEAIEQIRAAEPEEPAEILIEPEPLGLPVLMQGSQGEDVVELQKLLGMTGQLGFYGPMTVEKVKAFQKANGLEPDGVTGDDTWRALLA